MIRPVLLILLACLTASPAAAHWDRTRWGMTPEAVKALYPSAVPSGNPALVDPAKPVLELGNPYVYDGQSFEMARLFFRNQGKLDRVEFATLQAAQDRVAGLLAWLERRYGEPVSSEGPLSAPASGVDLLEQAYRNADGDKIVFMVLWADGKGMVAVAWEPPEG